MSVSQCANCRLIKEGILQAYEFLPEVYHQKFRNLVKQGGQTHVEFPIEKENAFGGCLTSMKDDDYNKLKKVILHVVEDQC